MDDLKISRPIGISILAWLLMLITICSIIGLFIVSIKLFQVNSLNFRSFLIIAYPASSIIFLSLGSIGMLKGKKIGWFLGAFIYFNCTAIMILIAGYMIFFGDVLLTFLQFLVLILLLFFFTFIYLYFFKKNVFSFFNLTDKRKMKFVLIHILIFVVVFPLDRYIRKNLFISDSSIKLIELQKTYDEGSYQKVIDEGLKYIDSNPDSAEVWGILGFANLALDNVKEAESCFNYSVVSNQNYYDGHLGSGIVSKLQGNLYESREHLLKAISIDDQKPDAFLQLLDCESKAKNYEKAAEYGQKAWSLSESGEIAANLSYAYHQLGDAEKSDLYFAHARRLKYEDIDELAETLKKRQ